MSHSPRSVSTTVTPASSRASARRISSVAIDLPFVTRLAPCRSARPATMRQASSPVSAQWTQAPASRALVSKVSRWAARSARVASRRALKWSRSSSAPGSSVRAPSRPFQKLPVAVPMAVWSRASPMASMAWSRNSDGEALIGSASRPPWRGAGSGSGGLRRGPASASGSRGRR